MHAPAVVLVVRSEEAAKGWLLVEHDEEVRDQEEPGHEGEKLDGLIEEGGAGDSQSGTGIHGVADEMIRSADDEAAGWIEGRGGAFADEGEGTNAGESHGGAGSANDEAGDLRPAMAAGRTMPDQARMRAGR